MTKSTKFGYFSQLHVQVRGYHGRGLIGYGSPQPGASLQRIADGFIKRIKTLLSPIIFGTVAAGIARMNNLKEVGRIGVESPIGRALANGNGVAMIAAAKWHDASHDNRAPVATR